MGDILGNRNMAVDDDPQWDNSVFHQGNLPPNTVAFDDLDLGADPVRSVEDPTPSLEGYWDRDDINGYMYPKQLSDTVLIGQTAPAFDEMLGVTGKIRSTGGYMLGNDSLFYEPSSNLLRFETNGVKAFDITNAYLSGANATFPWRINNASSPAVGTPTYTWEGDITTGMYRAAVGSIGFSGSGAALLVLNSDGSVRIPTVPIVDGTQTRFAIVIDPITGVLYTRDISELHTHTNNTLLDLLSDIGGALAYDGTLVADFTGYATEAYVDNAGVALTILIDAVQTNLDNHNHNLADLDERSYNSLTDLPSPVTVHTHLNKVTLDLIPDYTTASEGNVMMRFAGGFIWNPLFDATGIIITVDTINELTTSYGTRFPNKVSIGHESAPSAALDVRGGSQTAIYSSTNSTNQGLYMYNAGGGSAARFLKYSGLGTDYQAILELWQASLTGSSAVGMGVFVDFRLDNLAGAYEQAGVIGIKWADITDTAEESEMYIGVMTAGVYADKLKLNGEGLTIIGGGITLATGATVNNIETSLTDDDTHIPTSGAVWEKVTTVAYPITTLTVTTSDGFTGDVDSLATPNDADILQVEEAVGTPGFDIRFTATGITSFNNLLLRQYYHGGSNHSIHVELYNPNTTNWDQVFEFTDEGSFNYHSIPIFEGDTYIDSGTVIFRLYHDDPGNASHYIEIDYVVINALPQIGTGGGVSDHGGLVGLSDDDHSQYALLAGRTGDVLKVDTINGYTALHGVIVEQVTLIGGYILLEEIVEPAAPAAGKGAVYSEEDTLGTSTVAVLKYKDEEGTVHRLSHKRFVHAQGLASSTWTIDHNFGQEPNVMVYDDSTPPNLVLAPVKHPTVNQTVIEMPVGRTLSGKAICTI